MSSFYEGAATITLPDGTSVDADVDLWRDEAGPLVQWGGTAANQAVGSLWNGEQRMCTVKFGKTSTDLWVGECLIVESDPVEGIERVTLRGAGDFSEASG